MERAEEERCAGGTFFYRRMSTCIDEGFGHKDRFQFPKQEARFCLVGFKVVWRATSELNLNQISEPLQNCCEALRLWGLAEKGTSPTPH